MKIFLTTVILFIYGNIFSQIKPSLSNLLGYGNGEQQIGILNKDFEYIENVSDFRLSLPYSFTIGIRYLHDNPPEVGKSFKGVSRRFIEYKDKNLKLRIGNSSELYGRGLVLNLFENRGLAYDTWIDGIKAGYKSGKLKASIIAGEIEFTDSVTVYRTEIHDLKGGNLEYNLSKNYKLGFSFLRVESKIPQFDKSNSKNISELPELYFSYNNKYLSAFINYAHKWSKNLENKSSSRGFGIYSSLSYSLENIGITLDYKNYRFDLQNPLLQNDETRTTKYLPTQNPPIVMKEHSYTLLSRSLHEVDFNDEVGFQVEIDFVPTEKLSFNLNMSLSSRHDSYFFNNQTFEFTKNTIENNILPSTSSEYSPFMEIFLDSEYYFDFERGIHFGIAYREKTLYNYYSGIDGSHIIKSFVVPAQYYSPLNDNFSIIIQNEIEFVKDNFNVNQESFSNYYNSLTLSYLQKLTFAIRSEYTSNNHDISGKDFWFTGELGYRITSRNLVTISYGRERGGQICTNGICRYLLPFEGFRLTLQNSF